MSYDHSHGKKKQMPRWSLVKSSLIHSRTQWLFFFFCQITFSCFSFLLHLFPLCIFSPLCLSMEVLQHISHCTVLYITGKPFGCVLLTVAKPLFTYFFIYWYYRPPEQLLSFTCIVWEAAGVFVVQYSKQDPSRMMANSETASRFRSYDSPGSSIMRQTLSREFEETDEGHLPL